MNCEKTERKTVRTSTKLALVLMSTLLALLAAEVVLRVVWHNPYASEKSDRIVKLRLQHADADHHIDRSAIDPDNPVVRFHIDERNYIMPSFQFVDPDCTIAFLGGSTTECCAVAEPLRFPAVVGTELGKRGMQITTLNAGNSGNTLHDSVNLLINHVEQDRPDIVVVMHACNDIGLLEKFENYSERCGQHLDLAKIIRTALMSSTNYSYVLGLTRQALREHTHFLPTDPDHLRQLPELAYSEGVDGAFEKRLRVFIRSARAYGIEPVVMTQPISDDYTELTPSWLNLDTQTRFNDIVRRVAREEKTTLIDLVEHLKTNVPNWDTHLNVFYDGIHVTDVGSKIYGEHIADVLGDLILRLKEHPLRHPIEITEAPPDTLLR